MTVDILKLARKNGLNLIEETAVLNESGMDFQVLFAEDERGVSWVLRKPRRPDVIQRGGNEGKVLNLVQKHLPVSVPEWKLNTPELIAYPTVPGIQTGSIDMNIRNYVFNINTENLGRILSCLLLSLEKKNSAIYWESMKNPAVKYGQK
ncbi:hypothetical protein QFZ72_002804 [Bacillus sp. V2I10]|nr:hypothetical protein [Bacillus sp. V2I10]